MRTTNLLIKRFEENFLKTYGPDLQREAKNFLYVCLVNHVNCLTSENDTGQEGIHDDFMAMLQCMYRFFDGLDCLYADEVPENGKLRKV